MNNFLVLKNTYINVNHIVYIKKYKKGEWVYGLQIYDDKYCIHLNYNNKTCNNVLEISKTVSLDDYITIEKFIGLLQN